jgi:signal transduction histidine kinase
MPARLAARGTLVAGLGTAPKDIRAQGEAVTGGTLPDRETFRRLQDELEKSLGSAAEGAERVAQFARDLAIFGGPAQETARLKLCETVAAAIRWFPSSATALARVRVEDLTPPTVAASRGQIEQVLVNLISNAASATRPGQQGDVLVRLGPGSPGMARIEVIDRGVGIETSVLGRILDPFFTPAPPGRGAEPGSGSPSVTPSSRRTGERSPWRARLARALRSGWSYRSRLRRRELRPELPMVRPHRARTLSPFLQGGGPTA